MNKNPELQHHHRDSEILKAVAQAWYSHSGSSRPISEFDARRRNFGGKPSRFNLEATSKSSTKDTSPATATWDFSQSLWDPYELVTVSRRLETGLASDNPFADLTEIRRRKQESKNSLRNLFNQMSSRRFIENKVPKQNDTYKV